MGRPYTLQMTATSVSVAKSLIRASAASGKPFRVIAAYISQQASETSEQLEVRLTRATTDGTGTSGTSTKWNQTDSAFGGTYVYNLTAEPTKDTTEYWRESFNVLNGWVWYPPLDLVVIGGERIVLELMTAPGAALTMSCGIVIEEMG